MAKHLRAFADEGLINFAGGCCGTRPKHIKAIAEALVGAKPRPLPPASAVAADTCLRLSGLEPLYFTKELNFVNIGERCNIAGSRRFARLVRTGDFDEALVVARLQVESGAQVIDVNMDEGLIDSKASVGKFMRLISGEPDICKVPFMMDSSKFEVIVEGLKNFQGKCIANSISLKEGEQQFLMQGNEYRRLGAAVIVMAFDEEGQAVTKAHKVAICERSYKLLVEKVGMDPQDIIFDPNILTIGTGMEEHNDYGVHFLDAIVEIKAKCPGVRISGGVSNLSFAFRGMEEVRMAMHSAFLYHAIQVGVCVCVCVSKECCSLFLYMFRFYALLLSLVPLLRLCVSCLCLFVVCE
jgi:5-methyltetrahydrofolate--homocysteine methyltransferase